MSESLLRYWREDPLLNEHHEHWHLVYPYGGQVDDTLHTPQQLSDIEDGKVSAHFLQWNDRHGELFAYMHAQLLARYAAERLSVGLPPVDPLTNYGAPISEGYDPGTILKADGSTLPAAARPPNASLSDLRVPKYRDRPGAEITSQELFRDRIAAAIATASSQNRPPTISELAERIEPTDRFATAYFGALHNDGHLLIAFFDNDPNHMGVMYWEETAIRDPVFYRWHAHLDDMFKTYQNCLEPYEFSDLPPITANRFSVHGDSLGQNLLKTEMRNRQIPNGSGSHFFIDYLSHEDFHYEFEITNRDNISHRLTIRIFAAPEQNIDDPRAWIEMDKFVSVIGPKSTELLSRQSRDSSVVRHPVLTAQMLEGQQPRPDELGASSECKCGWPYTLLVPRGSPNGMNFRFIALVSPGGDIISDALDSANSASYCGVQDSTYPDVRPMGYPFDRPFKSTIADWIDGPDKPAQLASARVSIHHQ